LLQDVSLDFFNAVFVTLERPADTGISGVGRRAILYENGVPSGALVGNSDINTKIVSILFYIALLDSR